MLLRFVFFFADDMMRYAFTYALYAQDMAAGRLHHHFYEYRDFRERAKYVYFPLLSAGTIRLFDE